MGVHKWVGVGVGVRRWVRVGWVGVQVGESGVDGCIGG